MKIIFGLTILSVMLKLTICAKNSSTVFTSERLFFGNTKYEHVGWVAGALDEILGMGLKRSGIEGGIHLYVCRAKHNGRYTPGKLYTSRGDNYVECHIPENGVNLVKTTFEVLTRPVGKTRWILTSNSNLPPNAIAGGMDVNYYTLYVCRVSINAGVIPGKYDVPRGRCYYGRHGNEYYVTSNFEVLVEV